MNEIESILPEGEENAVPTEKLMRMLGVTSERQLRKMIADERKEGAVIISANKNPWGYFKPGTKEEIEAFVHKMERKGKGTLLAVRSARKAIDQYDDQISLEEYLKKIEQ